MAKVMFSCVGAIGHFHPMLGLARESRRQGHAVLFVTARGLARHVEAEGFDYLPAGLDDDERMEQLRPFLAVLSQVPPAEHRRFVFPKVFAEIEGPARLPAVQQAAEIWQPQLVVHDPGDFAAPLVAEVLDVPSVHHSWGPAVPLELIRLAAAAFARFWHSAGLEPDAYGGMYRGRYLDICPSGLQVSGWHAPGPVVAMQPVPGDARPGQDLPDWIPGAAKPLLYVTMGTYFNNPRTFALLLVALRNFRGSVLVTIGERGDPNALPAQPRHIHIARYVPQSLVMPYVSGVICHGGSNSILGALSWGVPVVCIPQGADQFDNAARCAERGLGIEIMPSQLSSEAAARAIGELLTKPLYRQNAKRVQQQISALPTAEVAARQLFGPLLA